MPAAIGHVATFRAPMDGITSAATRYATSGTANVIDTAADAAASVSEADTTDIQDLPAYVTPPTADIAPPTASTASSSRGDNSTQPC
eukprot:g40082.t1